MPSIINATTTAGVAVTGDNSGALALQTNNGTTAVTIDTSQNVGIGTTSPGANNKLHVSSAGTTRLYVENTANSVGVRLQTLSNAGLLQTDTNHPLTFATNNGAEAMRIATSGLVSTAGSFLSGGYVAGAGYYRSSGMVNETVTVTTAATVYGINKDSGAGGSSSTSTYDITGVPNQDGAFFFLYVRCSNTAAGINTVVIVTVHGSAELFRNSVQNTTKTGSVMLARQNGSWYVVAPYHTGAAISI
jgi:hypothetical protein